VGGLSVLQGVDTRLRQRWKEGTSTFETHRPLGLWYMHIIYKELRRIQISNLEIN
jgi:hypothetical protein